MEKQEYYSIGKAETRQDILDKVTGAALYSTDIHPKGMLYGKVLGSPIPHGYIKHIDTSEAEALPGVMAVVTGMDGPEERTIGGYLSDKHLLCRRKVRCIGDPVAAVAATSEQIAEQALKLIRVEYEPLPFVLDPEDAYQKDCPAVVHENVWDYKRLDLHGVAHCFDKEHPNQAIKRKVRHSDDFYVDPDQYEDPEAYDAAFQENFQKAYDGAYLKLETQRYEFPRVSHCFMEPHVCVAEPHPDGSISVWASEQGGKLAKYTIANSFGLSPSQVHMNIPYLGGGFGGKTGCPVTPPTVMLARKAGRPVKIVQTREEVFSAGNPRPPAVIYLTDGYDKDGTLRARKVEAYINCGAYTTYSLVMLDHSVYGVAGNYKNPNLWVDAYGVYTNTEANGPYRALGCELFVYAIERNLDKAAEALGIDKYEIRKRNVLQVGDSDGHGQTVTPDSNGSEACLDAAAEYIKWGTPARPADGPWRYGKGLSLGNKFTAYGHVGAEATCAILDDGTIELRNFHCEMGQGAMTVDSQHAAEIFKTPMSRIRILNQDGDNTPFDEGTYCSRGTYINGNAMILACEDAKRQLLRRAGEIMNIPPERLDTKDGMVYDTTNPDNKIGFGDVYEHGGWSREGQIVGKGTFVPEQALNNPKNAQGNPVLFYSIGSWGMEVGVNVETGEVEILDCGGFYDAGTVLNRATCEGQIEGALVMGIGQAVFEEIMVNDQGKVINGNYRDYKIPTFMDSPNNERLKVGFVEQSFPTGPNGAKGVGEVALIPVMAAIANAIYDATGAEIHEIPMTRERILAALREKAAKEAGT